MTTQEFIQANIELVKNSKPEGVSEMRFLQDFTKNFEKECNEYGFIGYPAFNDALEFTAEFIHTDKELEGIQAGNEIREHNLQAAKKIYFKR